MTRFQLDTDFFVYAISRAGPERARLRALTTEGADVRMSAVAWYEFARGERSPAQIAVALDVLAADGVVPFDAALASLAADTFRRLGRPRKRGQDIAIGVTAVASGATLLTRNAADFRGIDGLVVEPAEQ